MFSVVVVLLTDADRAKTPCWRLY